MSKHLIVGGLGNLGQHLQKRLLKQGASVRVLDRPCMVEKSRNRLSWSPEEMAVDVRSYTVGGNYEDPLILQEALEDVETVYAIVTPDVQFGTVRDFEATNVKGVQQLVEACVQVGTPKLVYGSSIAVTNHLVDSYNQKEDAPLPPLDEYQSHYDRTKRLGKEVVLAAANDSNTRLQACALRLGGIMGSPSDYIFQNKLENPGIIRDIDGRKPIDMIAAADVSRAMWQAHVHMDRASGKAINVTRSKDERVPTSLEMAQYIAQVMGWQLQIIPEWLFWAVRKALELQYNIWVTPFREHLTWPGSPPHIYFKIPLHEKTFDNGLAKELLDFEASMSWKDAVDAILATYKQNQNSMP